MTREESWQIQAELYAEANRYLENVVCGQGPTDDEPGWDLPAITVEEDSRGFMLAELEDNLTAILARNGYRVTWDGRVILRVPLPPECIQCGGPHLAIDHLSWPR